LYRSSADIKREPRDAEKLRHFTWRHKEGGGRDEIRSHRWSPV